MASEARQTLKFPGSSESLDMNNNSKCKMGLSDSLQSELRLVAKELEKSGKSGLGFVGEQIIMEVDCKNLETGNTNLETIYC